MLLSKAIQGYNFDKSANYSANTLETYKVPFANLIRFITDKDISLVSEDDLKNFIHWLQNDYVPKRANKDTSPLSSAYVDLHWKATRSLFGWASKVLNFPRPDLNMPRPKFVRAHVKPFSEKDIRKLLKGCEYSISRSRAGKEYTMRNSKVHRNKAIILTLLDTGLRIGELLRIQIRDIDFETGEIIIMPYTTGRKTKPRMVPLGKTTRRSLWLYVAKLEDTHSTDRLFPMSANATRLMLRRLATRTGIPNVHPHKFRHTFAIHYLRNGGDIFTLQKILGHSTLDMVRYYLDIANADVARAHRRASAVDRWNRDRPF